MFTKKITRRRAAEMSKMSAALLLKDFVRTVEDSLKLVREGKGDLSDKSDELIKQMSDNIRELLKSLGDDLVMTHKKVAGEEL